MRALITRHKMVMAAVATASAALLAACGPTNPGQPDPGASAGLGGTGALGNNGSKVALSAGMAVVSNGTTTVKVGEVAVTFPTTVTDAAFSHDGSRLVFVDGDGNLATSHPDGTGMVVLTKKVAGITRSSPAWYGAQIVYTRRTSSGAASLYMVASVPGGVGDSGEYKVEWPGGPTGGVDTAPSASAGRGAGMELAWQHTGSAGPEVWVVDTNQREPYPQKLGKGSAAEISPDGTRVAFVATNGQVSVLSTTQENAKPVQVSFGAKSPTHLAWSADGARVAFGTTDGVVAVSANVAAGATENPPTTLSGSPGVPTFAPPSGDRVMRLADHDLIASAVAASTVRWDSQEPYSPNEGNRTATGAFIVGLNTDASALAGLQGRAYRGPVLFTGAGGLDARTKAELKRIFGTAAPDYGPEITIIGGTGQVSTQAENDIKALGYLPERVTGDLTTAALPDTADWAGQFTVADVDDPAGLIQAVDFTSSFSSVLLLSKGGVLPAKARALLNKATASQTIYPLDTAGQQAVKANWSGKPSTLTIAPLIGTNAARLGAFGASADGIVLVDRSVPADLLLAASYAGYTGYAVLAVDGAAPLDTAVRDWLDKASGVLNRVVLVDSTGKISRSTSDAVVGAMSGPRASPRRR